MTHVLGIRAFGTQLLCEQVVGLRPAADRATRANDEAKFEPEYADVYGVPFSFLPCSGTTKTPSRARLRPAFTPSPTGSPARSPGPACWGTATSFPASGSRQVHRRRQARAAPTPTSRPRPRVEGIVGDTPGRYARRPEKHRANEVAFRLAKLTLETILPRRRGARQALALPPASGNRQAAGSANA